MVKLVIFSMLIPHFLLICTEPIISSIHDFSREPEEIQGKTKGILHLVPCKVDFMKR